MGYQHGVLPNPYIERVVYPWAYLRRILRDRRPSPAMVVASDRAARRARRTSVAAVVNVPNNSVGTAKIKNNAVTAPKIKNSAVNASKLASNAVTT